MSDRGMPQAARPGNEPTPGAQRTRHFAEVRSPERVDPKVFAQLVFGADLDRIGCDCDADRSSRAAVDGERAAAADNANGADSASAALSGRSYRPRMLRAPTAWLASLRGLVRGAGAGLRAGGPGSSDGA